MTWNEKWAVSESVGGREGFEEGLTLSTARKNCRCSKCLPPSSPFLVGAPSPPPFARLPGEFVFFGVCGSKGGWGRWVEGLSRSLMAFT